MNPEELLALAKERLIRAELRGLSGYDHKLLERLLDSSRLRVDDDGNVLGLREAVAAVEREYPAVKSAPVSFGPLATARNLPKRSPINDLFRK